MIGPGQRMRLQAVRLFVLCGLLASSAAPASGTPAAALQMQLEQVLREQGLTGAVWATSIPDGGMRVGAAGHMDATTGEPMRPDARVQVGSVTKAVLAIGVLLLISEGRLSLDTPVSELLPGIRIDNPWARSDPVRVRHLLSHTAGLENLRLWQFFSLEAEAETPLALTFARSPLHVQTRPGSRFGYSNIGYGLLGMVIEAVTGERYEQVLDRDLLPRLGMHDSRFAFSSQTGSGADPRLAMGHWEHAVPHPSVPLHLRPASQFTTTAGDMAKFARFLIGDGRADGLPLIDPALHAAMTRPAATEAADAGLPLGRGLVLAGRDRHGVVGDCHPGNTVGFWAMLCVYPQHAAWLFVAVNTDSETADYERLIALLVTSLDLPRRAQAMAGKPSGSLHQWDGVYVRTPAAMPRLGWLDTVSGLVRLKADGDLLWMRPIVGAERRLTPVGGLLFRTEGRTLPSHALLLGDDGRQVITDGLRSHARVAAWRVVLPGVALLAGALAMLWIVAAGTARLLRRRLRPADPLFAPWLGVMALPLPLPWLLDQSMLQLGDRTPGSLITAAVTAALPMCLLLGLVQAFRSRHRRGVLVDMLVVSLALQATALLIAWDLLPLRLWTL